jgi:hypothetical protein
LEHILQPVNVAGALLIVQVCLLGIMTIGLFFDAVSGRPFKSNLYFIAVTILAIVSILCVAFISDFYPIWAPILGDINLPTLHRQHAFLVIFSLDIIVVYWLITGTGGSNRSPFTSVLFLIPSLAIFLREPPFNFIAYSIAAFLIFTFTFSSSKDNMGYGFNEIESPDHVHKIVTGACMFLGVVTGYITRPLPI